MPNACTRAPARRGVGTVSALARDEGYGLGMMWRHAATLLQTLLLILSACSRPPEDPESRYRLTVRARALLEAGDAGAAQDLLEDVARAGQKPWEWVNLGLVQQARGHSGAAAKSWEKALRAEPAEVRALYHAAALHLDRARAAAEEARTHPGRADKLATRARNELESAASLLERAAAADAHNAAIPHMQERVQRALGDSASALAARREAERLDPVHAGATPSVYGLGKITLPPLRRPVLVSRTTPKFNVTRTRFRASDLVALDLDTNGRRDLVLVGTAAALRCDSAPDAVRWLATRLNERAFQLARSALFDADAHTDLVLFARARRGGHQAWLVQGGTAVPQADSSLATRYQVADAVPLDVDHDGDLDLVLAATEAPGLHLWRNDGRGRFAEEAMQGSWPATRRLVAADLDADGYTDLVCIDFQHRILILGGRGDGTFVERTLTSGLVGRRARAAAATDIDADGDCDLLLGDDEGLWVWGNVGAGRFGLMAAYRETQSAWSGEPHRGVAVAALHVADFDNDGLQDVLSLHFPSRQAEFATTTPTAASAEDTAPIARRLEPLLELPPRTRLALWRNEGNGVFSDVTSRSQLDGVDLVPRCPTSADFDADGDLDVACVGADSLVQFLWNRGGSDNRRLEMQLVDERRPSASHGARVELFAAGRVRHAQTQGAEAWIGIGRIESVDVMRIVWPDGSIDSRTHVALPEDGRLRVIRRARR
ncbi:MAG: VCBS repeat-containing protein [Candidatus Latescibacterota bacterium]|nr:MAG: VCBS repeat-containing protein [Candidatus Latescibacterota bacterium]